MILLVLRVAGVVWIGVTTNTRLLLLLGRVTDERQMIDTVVLLLLSLLAACGTTLFAQTVWHRLHLLLCGRHLLQHDVLERVLLDLLCRLQQQRVHLHDDARLLVVVVLLVDVLNLAPIDRLVPRPLATLPRQLLDTLAHAGARNLLRLDPLVVDRLDRVEHTARLGGVEQHDLQHEEHEVATLGQPARKIRLPLVAILATTAVVRIIVIIVVLVVIVRLGPPFRLRLPLLRRRRRRRLLLPHHRLGVFATIARNLVGTQRTIGNVVGEGHVDLDACHHVGRGDSVRHIAEQHDTRHTLQYVEDDLVVAAVALDNLVTVAHLAYVGHRFVRHNVHDAFAQRVVILQIGARVQRAEQEAGETRQLLGAADAMRARIVGIQQTAQAHQLAVVVALVAHHRRQQVQVCVAKQTQPIRDQTGVLVVCQRL